MAHNISIPCPTVPHPCDGTVGQRRLISIPCGTHSGTMSLKTLADKVLSRDKVGTKLGTDFSKAETKNLFLVPQHLQKQYEERAAIMEFDGGLSRGQAEKAAYDDIMARGKNGQK